MNKIIALLLSLILAGCGVQTNTMEKDFKFLSLEWGDSWENVQQAEAFKNAENEVMRDNEIEFGIMIKEIDFYEKTVDVGLMFGKDVEADYGLNTVYVQYKEEDEGDLLAMMTEVYGERQSFVNETDPINPPGWYCEERVGTSFTDAEKELYISKLRRQEPTFVDAYLRQPLVVIRFDEENNTIRFYGVDAAVVRNIKGD